MLVLIATNELQGTALGDYAWTVEGELVTPLGPECSMVGCGCTRGFPGLASGTATTTAMVVERPGVTRDDLRDAIVDHLDRTGWIRLIEQTALERWAALGDDDDPDEPIDDPDELIAALVDEHLEMIEQVCAAFPVGTVVGRREDVVQARHPHLAA
jgi:hypothetical protein